MVLAGVWWPKESPHCDGQPCCSPWSHCPGKPCRCRWRASRRQAGPRWGGTNLEPPGWRCSSCGPLWTRKWRRWGRCCPPGGCPADTRSRGRGSCRWLETHSPPWCFAPGMSDMETSEAPVEGTKKWSLNSLQGTYKDKSLSPQFSDIVLFKFSTDSYQTNSGNQLRNRMDKLWVWCVIRMLPKMRQTVAKRCSSMATGTTNPHRSWKSSEEHGRGGHVGPGVSRPLSGLSEGELKPRPCLKLQPGSPEPLTSRTLTTVCWWSANVPSSEDPEPLLPPLRNIKTWLEI